MPRKSIQHQRRKLRTLLGLAIIFSIMGVGNLLIGNSRVKQYNQLLDDSQQVVRPDNSSEPETAQSYLPHSAIDLDRQNLRVSQFKTRLDFYRIVVVGGRCFLVLSAFLLLFCLVLSRDGVPGKVKDDGN